MNTKIETSIDYLHKRLEIEKAKIFDKGVWVRFFDSKERTSAHYEQVVKSRAILEFIDELLQTSPVSLLTKDSTIGDRVCWKNPDGTRYEGLLIKFGEKPCQNNVEILMDDGTTRFIRRD